MDPLEVEFLAEKETVKIIPNFSLDKIYLIGVRKQTVAIVYIQVKKQKTTCWIIIVISDL